MRAELEVVRNRPTDTGSVSGERELSVSRERELGAIVADMWENGEKLVRQELELGMAELDLRIDKLKQSLLMATIGGAVLYAGVLVLLAAAVLGLANVVAPWLAALIVGGPITAVGAFMVLRGEQKAVESVKPDEHSHRTARAMKEAIK
jgi:hypothetical protein